MAGHVHSGPTGDAWPGMSTLVPQGTHGLACPLWSHRGHMAWNVHSGPTGDAWPGMSTLVPQGTHGLACPLACVPCGTRVDMPGHASPVGHCCRGDA